jgi:hypothetical protein
MIDLRDRAMRNEEAQQELKDVYKDLCLIANIFMLTHASAPLQHVNNAMKEVELALLKVRDRD